MSSGFQQLERAMAQSKRIRRGAAVWKQLFSRQSRQWAVGPGVLSAGRHQRELIPAMAFDIE